MSAYSTLGGTVLDVDCVTCKNPEQVVVSLSQFVPSRRSVHLATRIYFDVLLNLLERLAWIHRLYSGLVLELRPNDSPTEALATESDQEKPEINAEIRQRGTAGES